MSPDGFPSSRTRIISWTLFDFANTAFYVLILTVGYPLYFKKIEEALLRIKEGTYGRCQECHGYIGAKRLEARPTAELCIECKESAERLENLSAEGRKPKSLGRAINFKA